MLLRQLYGDFRGVRGVFKLLGEEKYKMRIRVFISRYVSPFECKKCHGSRLNDSAWVAIEVILEEKQERELIPKLKRAGASGIITYPLNKVIP